MCMRPMGCIIRNATAFWMKISEISLPNSGSIWSIWLSADFTIRSLMRSSIDLSRNENVADAQLPAYCFMPTRNDTYCGRRAPRMIGARATHTTSTSRTGFMSVTAYPSLGGKLANRNATQNMKNTFHSNGTASGIVEMMKVWSIQIEMIATQVHGYGANNSTSGITISHVVPPMCARACVTFDGRRSLA